MAFSTITIFMSNSSTKTKTLTTSDLADAQAFVQNAVRFNGGIWDDTNQTFIPVNSIQQITVA